MEKTIKVIALTTTQQILISEVVLVDAMDIGELQKEIERLKVENESWELDAVGKGKKGYKGKKLRRAFETI